MGEQRRRSLELNGVQSWRPWLCPNQQGALGRLKEPTGVSCVGETDLGVGKAEGRKEGNCRLRELHCGKAVPLSLSFLL